MTVNSAFTSDKTIGLTYGGTGFFVASSYEVVFIHKDKTICPITSVELKNEGCTDALSGDNISIGSSPFAITAKNNIASGYTKKFCAKATVTPADTSKSPVVVTKDSISMR